MWKVCVLHELTVDSQFTSLIWSGFTSEANTAMEKTVFCFSTILINTLMRRSPCWCTIRARKFLFGIGEVFVATDYPEGPRLVQNQVLGSELNASELPWFLSVWYISLILLRDLTGTVHTANSLVSEKEAGFTTITTKLLERVDRSLIVPIANRNSMGEMVPSLLCVFGNNYKSTIMSWALRPFASQ